jgi:hypothetical protein
MSQAHNKISNGRHAHEKVGQENPIFPMVSGSCHYPASNPHWSTKESLKYGYAPLESPRLKSSLVIPLLYFVSVGFELNTLIGFEFPLGYLFNFFVYKYPSNDFRKITSHIIKVSMYRYINS